MSSLETNIRRRKSISDGLAPFTYQNIDFSVPSLGSEGNTSGLGIHCIDYCKRLKLNAQITNDLAAYLEAFFDNYANAFNACARGLGNGDKALQSAAVCKKVINYQNSVIRVQELF